MHLHIPVGHMWSWLSRRVVVWGLECEPVVFWTCGFMQNSFARFCSKLYRLDLFMQFMHRCRDGAGVFCLSFTTSALSYTQLWAFACAFLAGSPRVKVQYTSPRISLRSNVVACAINRIRLNGPGNDISAITLMVTAQYCISSVQIVCLNVCLSIFNLIVHSLYINLDNKTCYICYICW